jgi:hypothetical protein
MDGDRAVGFESVIQHYRTIDGITRRMAHGSSWVVLPEYRRCSLLIKNAWRSLAETGFELCEVGMSSRVEFIPLLKLLGASILETAQLWLRPALPTTLSHWRLSEDPSAIWDRLSEHDRQVFLDHQNLPCHHLFAWNEEGYCYVVSARRWGPKRLGSSTLFYISHPEHFVQAQTLIHLGLARQNRAFWINADERLFRGHHPAGAHRVPLATPRMYQSKSLKPELIDNLYSELILLEL